MSESNLEEKKNRTGLLEGLCHDFSSCAYGKITALFFLTPAYILPPCSIMLIQHLVGRQPIIKA